MINLKRHIPNTLTSLNLVCGVLAIFAIFQGAVYPAAILIAAALIFDFLDGFVARLLQVHSPMGKELDSLADAVTFGVVPGMIMMRLIQESQGLAFPPEVGPAFFANGFPWLIVGVLVSVFSIIRLAKFNLDERQANVFFGFATPANTLLILSFWMIVSLQPESGLAQVLNHTYIWIGFSLLLSYLLVADIRLIAFKFKHYGFGENRYRYILMISGIFLLAIFQYMAIPFLILLYFLLSGLQNLSEKDK